MMSYRLSKNMRNAVKISTGTIVGQVVSIIALPIVTRIYGADIIGIWTTIFALSSLICTFSDLGIIQSIMVEKDEVVGDTYSVCSTLIFIISVLAAIIVFFYCKIGLRYANDLTFVIVMFSMIYAMTYQLVQLDYTFLNREGNYSILMKNPIINQVVAALVSIGLGLFGATKYGYYIGVTVGQLVTLLHMKCRIPYKFRFVGIEKIKNIVIRQKKFVSYQMPVNITMQAREQIPNLLIGALFGNRVLGCYSVSQKLLNIPITFLGQALGRVFYQRCAEMKRKGEDISLFFYRNMKRALQFAIIPMTFFAAFGDAAIVMFFGHEYTIAGIMVRIVVFRAFFAFVSAATRSIDIILDKQQYAMMSTLLQTIFISFCVVFSANTDNSAVMCVVMMTVAFIVIQIVYFCAMFKVMHLPVRYYLKGIIISLIIVVVSSAILRYLFVFITDATRWRLFEFLKQFLVM